MASCRTFFAVAGEVVEEQKEDCTSDKSGNGIDEIMSLNIDGSGKHQQEKG